MFIFIAIDSSHFQSEPDKLLLAVNINAETFSCPRYWEQVTVECSSLTKSFIPPPLKPREHHGKGSRKNIRTGRWIEGLWKSIFWEWHGHCNQELTADTCVTVQLPALAKTRLALSIISHRSGRDTYTSLLSCGLQISGMGLIAFSCVPLLSSLSSSICFQTCGNTGGPD